MKMKKKKKKRHQRGRSRMQKLVTYKFLYLKGLIVLLITIFKAKSFPTKCDQTPAIATVDTPSENRGQFVLDIQNSGSKKGEGKFLYTPNQTYVLTITSMSNDRSFIWFMITAEDPDIDNNFNDFANKYVDVGSMKTLDTGRSSESCFATVESADYSEKNKVSIHWVSPSPDAKNEAVRIRATVAENDEYWYDGEDLTIMLYKDHKKAVDNPPVEPRATCNLNSEARYEVIFEGKWSRMAHPRHYPSKPDENGYTHMVGASHAHGYPIWAESLMATEGLREMVLTGETTMLEDEIISNMALKTGTRTLIRGKRRHHPFMSEPSHALFRVDKYHHQFSIVVGMKPSPDWFLGTSKFELCTDDGWYERATIPLYPWDAGIMDGDSYESKRTATAPQYTINRVEIGSFKSSSPFYKMNLDSLKPFAMLTVRRLDVYTVIDDDDDEEENADNPEEQESS